MAHPAMRRATDSETEEWQVETHGRVCNVRLFGDLLVGNRKAFEADVRAAMGGGSVFVTIDCMRCGHLDSAAIGVLSKLERSASERGGWIALEHLNDELRTLFEYTKLDSRFRIR